ncbi:MAG: MopE-related protein [Myxococcota bacterium]
MRLLPLLLASALLLPACGPDVNVTKRDVDNDGDGYTDKVDCDDAHASVNPDAVELCDGLDNDCDLLTDEDATDATTWYADLDGDGHGDADAATLACDAPADAVAEAGDCDDADATAFPGAAELCDGVDDDCDGVVDEDADDVRTFYGDDDGDGYGDAAAGVTACAAGPGQVEDGTDCDDADAAIHPDAAEADCADPVDYNCDGAVGYTDGDTDGVPACEDCDDGDAGRSPLLPEVCDAADRDEDCDAVADDADPSTNSATHSSWYADADADTYGDPADSTAACDAPAGHVANDADCDDTDAAVSPAATELCDASDVDEDCDGLADDDDTGVSGATTWYRDADADTYGNPVVTTATCDLPTGYVTNDDDCDDTTNTVSPAATEQCDASDVDEDCDGLADDADASATGESTWYRDADADTYGNPAVTTSTCDMPTGYVTNDDDCDDSTNAVSPADTEVCDAANVDEDCDGLADDADASATGASTWYRDADADTYGNPAVTTSTCDMPTGYVTNDDDCNDTTNAVSPADTEVCDITNVDEDCDGLADDADTAATGKGTWYRDADTDTYGNPAVTTSTCDMPSGYVTNDDDCNDTTNAVSPADTEVCDAANVDEDCDGLADDSDTSATGKSTWYRDADTDTYGNAAVTASMCEMPTGYVTNDDDCDDVHDDAHPGGVEVCDDDIDQDCAGGDEECPVTHYDGAYYVDSGYHLKLYGRITDEWFGETMTAGDFNGDGVGDLVVGSSQYRTGIYEGTVLGYYGPFPTGTSLASDVDSFGYGASTLSGSETFGKQVYNLGDLDDDGKDDLAAYYDYGDEWFFYKGGDVSYTAYTTADLYVSFSGYECTTVSGAGNVASAAGNEWLCGEDETSVWRGTVYVHSGFSESDTALATLTGENANDYAGRGVVTGGGGDIDGDGIDDVVIGAPGADNGDVVDAGAAYVVYGPVTGTIPLYTADLKLVGGVESEGVGTRIRIPGDVDGDGIDDLLLGAPYGGPEGYARGAVYLVTNPASGDVATQAAGTVVGGVNYDTIGERTLDAGDFNGDGATDVLVGSDDNGSTYVAYGPITGMIDLATDGASWTGTTLNEYVGYSVAAIPDSDGDGKDEIAMGAILHDYTTGTSSYASNRGAVWIWLGE